MFALPGKTIVDENDDTKSYDEFYSTCFSDAPQPPL